MNDRVVPVVVFINKGRRKAELKLGGDRYCYYNSAIWLAN
jgi:hypothetical protein